MRVFLLKTAHPIHRVVNIIQQLRRVFFITATFLLVKRVLKCLDLIVKKNSAGED